MITYKYKCTDKKCDCVIEIKQRITEDKLKICPNCKQETFERQIQKADFVLKGAWFRNGGY